MKTNIKIALVGLMLFLAGQSALAECAIYASACPKPPITDALSVAGYRTEIWIDPHTCYRRAREWQAYCGNGGYAVAYFGKDGVYTSAITAYPGGFVLYQIDTKGTFIPLQNSY